MSKERTEERTKTHARDSINRQATIEHLKKRLIETAINNTGVIARCDSIFEDTADNRIGTWINEVPSAQPERKTGEWIDYTDEGYVECPFCHSATNCDGNKDELHFCFSCGADMRGKQT